MNSTITISIVIPVYNASRYVEECLESVESACENLENRCRKTAEIICIDDGSTDGSGGILDRLAKKCQKIRVLHKRNEGVSAARNDGIRLAQGEWIHFVDADDWIEPSLYADLASWADRCPKAESIVFGVVEMDQDNQIVEKWGEACAPTEMSGDELLGDVRYWIFTGCIWNKIYKRDVLQCTGLLFDTKMQPAEDNLFNMMFLTYCRRVVVRPEVAGYYYRATPDSCIHTMTARKLLFSVDQFLHLYDRWMEIRMPGLERKLASIARGILFLGKRHSPQLRHECVEALVRIRAFRDVVIPYLLKHGKTKDRIFSMVYVLMPRNFKKLMLKFM